jgi:hypothetical protein
MTIHDGFTDLPISRFKRWYLRKKAAGLCTHCGVKKTKFVLCNECQLAHHYQKGDRLFKKNSPRKMAAQKRAEQIKAREGKPKKPQVNPWEIKEKE